MVSLFTESYSNSLVTDRNMSLNSNIKKLIQAMISPSVTTFEKICNVKDNIFFRDEKVDIMHTFPNTFNAINVLESNGYLRTTIDDYNSNSYNFSEKTTDENYLINISPEFKDEIILNSKGLTKVFSYFVDNNFIVFYDVASSGDKYFYNVDEAIILKDFKIDKDDFVHIIYSYNSENYYAKSSLYLPFLKLNSENDIFDESCFLQKIKLDSKISKIFAIKNNNLYLFDDEYNIKTSKLSKRYYFEHNGLIYFNHSDIYEVVKKSIINEFIQLNNLNMYNYISLLGINEFKTFRNLKISTLDGELFNNIFKNRFNNTINGGINYFTSKESDKTFDYKVNIKDGIYAINGNFIPGKFKGNFEIEIDKNKCNLYLIKNDNRLFVKSCDINSNTFYFCNLKFEYLRFDTLNKKYKFEISNFDPYPFNLECGKTVEVNKIYNDKKISNKIFRNIKVNGFYNYKVDTLFDGKSIVINNFYDFKRKKYLFDSHTIKVKRNEKFNISKYYDFKFTGPFIKKGKFIYFREDGEITYTSMPDFKFQLINDLGYITDFWTENQDKEIYFKIDNNQIMITENSNECDFICNIPSIDDYVVNHRKYTNVIIDDNNEYESECDEDTNILITEKFMNVPLFNMVYVENTDEIEIFTMDKKKVYNVITEPYNGGLIAYFDNLDETLYYNTKDTKYNYFNPKRSYENITNSFTFDDNNEINFGSVKRVENFTIGCDRAISSYETINLILYNHEKGETHKLQLNSSEIDKVFELSLDIDSIYLEKNNSFDNAKISFKITKINSIIQNGKITYLKSKIDNQVYQAKLKDSSVKFSNYTSVRVGTKYELTNGILKESYNGDISIREPFENEILIMKKDNFQYYYTEGDYYFVKEKDEFYSKNFKTPGIMMKTADDITNIKTSNEFFTVDEIIDKEYLLGGKNEQ